MIKPRRLTTGSTLQIIMPASAFSYGTGLGRRFSSGLSELQKHFRVSRSKLEEGNHLGFAAPDELRAKELNGAVRAINIDGMIAGRGGYGCLRLINQIDYVSFRSHPKPLVGLSDLTILQLAIYQKSGVITFSGPLVLQLNSGSSAHLERLLTASTKNLDIITEANKSRIDVLSEGTAEGQLIGGNLYSMVQLAGTGLLPRFDNSILFFEDVEATVDQVDSYLQHLKLAGALYHVAGVVIGNFRWRKDQPTGGGDQAEELFRMRLEGMFRKDTPIISGVDYGHIDDTMTIPLGASARLDTESRSLTLLEDVTNG